MPPTGIELLQNAAGANGNGTALTNLGDTGAVLMQITGTFTATVNFEGSLDGGTTYVAIRAQDMGAATKATTATAAGMWLVPCFGMSNVRARVSGFSSGTVTVRARRAPAGVTPSSTA